MCLVILTPLGSFNYILLLSGQNNVILLLLFDFRFPEIKC